MPRSSGRGQVEPLAALAAVLAVGVGLGLYAGVSGINGGTDREHTRADVVLEEALAASPSAVVVVPGALPRPAALVPPGWRANLTLRTTAGHRAAGPPRPLDADTATRLVPVRLAPGRVRPGRLRVAVWR